MRENHSHTLSNYLAHRFERGNSGTRVTNAGQFSRTEAVERRIGQFNMAIRIFLLCPTIPELK